MKDSGLSVAVTVKVGSAALTLEMQKKEAEKPTFKIEAKNDDVKYIECKKDKQTCEAWLLLSLFFGGKRENCKINNQKRSLVF